jgi:hypothetical protein
MGVLEEITTKSIKDSHNIPHTVHNSWKIRYVVLPPQQSQCIRNHFFKAITISDNTWKESQEHDIILKVREKNEPHIQCARRIHNIKFRSIFLPKAYTYGIHSTFIRT